MNYVNNVELLACIVEYKKAIRKAKKEKKDKPPIPNFAGTCIMLIAKNLASLPRFCNYSFKDDMIGDGVENCIMYFDNFDPKISKNPFAYFTQITYFAFIRRITKEQKQQYIKYKYFANSKMMDVMIDDVGDEDMSDFRKDLNNQVNYDNINVFITSFEEKIKNKKKKVAEKKKKGLEKFVEE